MTLKRQAVRLAAEATEGRSQSTPEPAAHRGATLEEMADQQRRRQRLLFREVTTRLRRTSSDLQRLSQLRQTCEVKHPAPWSPELAGLERLLTSEEAWREYQQRYLFTVPAVQLPPPREVNIALLTARIAGEQPMLPTPGRTCAQGFYPPPGRSRLAHNEPRPRSLLSGACLPNTVVIRLLWSTRTLLDVEYYRAMENRRTRRRQHWQFFEWSDSDEEIWQEKPPESLKRLESVATRRRNRRKISMTKHEHLENWLHIAETGADEDATPDSEDEIIAQARQRRVSRRGRLLSDVDGTEAIEEDAYMPAFGRFTCGTRTAGKKRRAKKPEEGLKTPLIRGRSKGDDVEYSLDEDAVSSSSSTCVDSGDRGRKQTKQMVVMSSEDDTVKGEFVKTPVSTLGEKISGRTDTEGKHCKFSEGRHSQTGLNLSQAVKESDRARTFGPELADQIPGPDQGSAFRTATGGHSGSVPYGAPSPWTATDAQAANKLQVKRPTRRAGSVPPKTETRGRMSMPGGEGKRRLSATRVRPDMEADVASVGSAHPPSITHALRVPHLFNVKDYACEDSKVAHRRKTGGMSFPGAKRLSKQRDRNMMHSAGKADENTSLPQEVWSSSRIPGVQYDVNAKSIHENDEAAPFLAEHASDKNILSATSQPGTDLSKPNLHSQGQEGHSHHLAVEHIQHIMHYEWAYNLLHGVSCDKVAPCEVAGSLVKGLEKHSFEVQQEILHEVQTIIKIFPVHSNLHPVSNGIIASLYPATEDVVTLTMAIDTLLLIADQMDAVFANILALLTLEKPDVRETLLSLLERLGLVDQRQFVLTEALSWAPGHKRINSEDRRKEIVRRALNFIDIWTQAFEAHSKLIADEVNKRKMDAVVKYNIIQILKNYEPGVVAETSDGFNVNLRKPSSTKQLKNPEMIEVLNYFVEMTDEEDGLRQSLVESVHMQLGGQPEIDHPLQWRRQNRDLLVPPWPSPAVQGNRPLAAGVLRPTALVTHWRGAAGLAPGPWPTVTVGIHLRIADKYYRGT